MKLTVFWILCLALPLAAEEGMTREQALQRIRTATSVDAGAVGVAGIRTETYEAYLVIEAGSSRDQLLGLAADDNVNFRAYAAWALARRFPKEDFFELLMEAVEDEREFLRNSGCFSEVKKIGDHYVETFGDGLEKKQRAELLHYLLTRENELSATSQAMSGWEIPERYHPLLRARALEGNPDALVGMAKFERIEDVPVIIAAAKEHPFHAYRCMAMNPQPPFFDALAKAHPDLLAEEYWSTTYREYYQAVAAYRSEAALAILSRPLDGDKEAIPMKKYHIDFVSAAAAEYRDEIYDGLKWRLWREHKLLSGGTYRHLLSLDRGRAIRLTRETLDDLDWKTSDEDLTAMLEVMEREDIDYAVGVIAKELRKCHVSRYQYFADLARESLNRKYIEPLFQAVEGADNPHVFLAATQSLLAFEDAEIDGRIVSAPDKNPHLSQGWGGKAFRGLLDQRDTSAD